MKVYYINLDRVPERARFMQQQFARAEILDPIRFSAIDAAQGLDAAGYRPKTWGPYWTLRRSEVAVFESHRALWTKISAAQAPGAIFEDDVFLSHTAGAVLARIAGQAHPFDAIKLDGVREVIRLGAENRLCGEAMRPIRQVIPSAAAYVLSPRGARDLLARTERYCDHLDDVLTRPTRTYCPQQLTQAIAVQGMFADLNAQQNVPASIFGSERTKVHTSEEIYERGPTAYRIAKEARRSLLRLSRRLFEDQRLVRTGGQIGAVALAPDLPPYRSV